MRHGPLREFVLGLRRTYLYLEAATRTVCLAFGFVAGALVLRTLASRSRRIDDAEAKVFAAQALLVMSGVTAAVSGAFVVAAYWSAHRVADVVRRG